jgi:DNA invertase Pin-like site-specific DNA recombinase
LRQSSILQREIISLFIDHASKPADIALHLGISRMTVYRALARWNGEFDDDTVEGSVAHGHVTNG